MIHVGSVWSLVFTSEADSKLEVDTCIPFYILFTSTDAVVDSSTCSVQSEPSLSPIPLMTPLPHSPLPISVSMSRISLKGRTRRKRSLASESDDSTIGSPARKVCQCEVYVYFNTISTTELYKYQALKY